MPYPLYRNTYLNNKIIGLAAYIHGMHLCG